MMKSGNKEVIKMNMYQKKKIRAENKKIITKKFARCPAGMVKNDLYKLS